MLARGFLTLAATSLALVSGEAGAPANSTGHFLEPVQEAPAAAAKERPGHLPEENSGCRSVHSTCDPSGSSYWQCCPGLVCVTPASGGIYCEIAATAEVKVNGTVGDQDIQVASVSAGVVGVEPGPAMTQPEVLAAASTGSSSGSTCQYMIWQSTQEGCENMYPRYAATYAAWTWSGVASRQSCVYTSSSTCLDDTMFKIVGAADVAECYKLGRLSGGFSKACFERSPGLCYLTNGASSFVATPVQHCVCLFVQAPVTCG